MKLLEEVKWSAQALARTPFYLISGSFFFSKAFRSKAIHDKLVNEKQLLELIKANEHNLSNEDRKLINEFIRKYKRIK